MENSKFEELERLASELHDGGLSKDQLDHLNQLLFNDDEAQDFYCDLVNTHVGLKSVVGRSFDGSNEWSLPFAIDSDAEEVASYPGASSRKASPWRWVLAASIALVACSAAWLVLDGNKAVVARGGESMVYLPTITRVSWKGPTYQTAASEHHNMVAVPPGAIKLRQTQGEDGDGYLFCLEPGYSVELVAAFDAAGENSLSIAEVFNSHAATARKFTFHNAGKGPKPLHANPAALNRRYGVLGRWSESNTTDIPRFFLLTGVHKLSMRDNEDHWRMSSLRVQLESDDVVQVGWDDSGPAPLTGTNYRPDNDFDDLSASLFFTANEKTPQPTQPKVDVIQPLHVDGFDFGDEVPEGFNVELLPGDMLLMKGLAQASDPNALMLYNVDTDKVLWSNAKVEGKSDCDLGSTCVRNTTSSPQTIRVIGFNRPTALDKSPENWHVSSRATLYEQSGFYIIGYDDLAGDRDYNDVRVSLLIMQPE
ncbi:hypothetical protein [Aeoliella mucimassa]|uniref:Uncharacterized protein n=1 Tax=Aeoliella mucimassa TaxID=2527972 RepID=A0A518AVP6_9BACT|nr:hypothetical protein [Aeoliella mucimassa]QDU58809.1 hypothetical protein Pan181_50490 [Aeoliella mucimassa]